ncbi:MAG TPA: hypothetical protein VGN49_08650 [Micrococcaceae bacterium]|jgi:hypothetical protein|nr:hypothetical protein [Micrococcaceae bacterium]
MTTAAGHLPPRGDDVARLARRLGQAAEEMDSLREQLHAAGQLEWYSRAATAFKDALLLRERRMRDTAADLRSASAGMQRYAAQLYWDQSSPNGPPGPS